MISIKDIILTFRNIKKEIDDIKERILYIPGPGDLIGSNFGELNKEYDGKYSEVTFLKGSKELIDGYAGSQGQIVVDYNTNDIYLMKGGGEFGGTKLLKDGDNNQLYETKSIQVNASDWVFENSEFTFTINHNLNVEIEDLDIKFFKINSIVYFKYTVIDRNSIKIISDKELDTKVIIKAYKNTTSQVYYKDISVEEWNDNDNSYSLSIMHGNNISLENIDVKFYNDNSFCLLDYDVIDNNYIKIYSDEKIRIKIIIRKVL